MDVVAEIRDNPTAKDIKETHPTVNVAANTMIKAIAKPVISSMMSAVNEDTSGSLHDNNCAHHQGND